MPTSGIAYVLLKISKYVPYLTTDINNQTTIAHAFLREELFCTGTLLCHCSWLDKVWDGSECISMDYSGLSEHQ